MARMSAMGIRYIRVIRGCWNPVCKIVHLEARGEKMHRATKIIVVVVLLISSSIFLFGLGQKQPKVNTPSSVVWKSPPEGQSDNYAGAEACAACHPVHADILGKSAHAKAALKGC